MAKKRILTELSLDKIAAVDHPCQEGARAVILKRDETKGDADAARKAAGISGTSPSNPDKESDMSDDIQKKLGDLETQVAQLTKAKDAVVKAVETAGFTVTIDGESVVVGAPAEVEYIEFEGERVEKSAIPPALLKGLEARDARLAKLEKAAEDARIEKAAEALLPSLSGTPAAKAALYRAVDGIETDETRDAVLAVLKSADAAMAMHMAERGGTPQDDDSSAKVKLEKMSKAYAEEHGITKEQAFDRITQAGEGAQLYREMRSAQRSTNA